MNVKLVFEIGVNNRLACKLSLQLRVVSVEPVSIVLMVADLSVGAVELVLLLVKGVLETLHILDGSVKLLRI